ncbi:DUF5677 domain-containing protein [Lysinibacter cavernae]|uniref:DUF5677 domain-containing protein n=1 Tax=Lysinibacter cavernae TaxID=1640652 RepID=UPI0036128FB1
MSENATRSTATKLVLSNALYTIDLAKPYLQLLTSDLVVPALALARITIESSVNAAWFALAPKAADAAAHETLRNKKNFLTAITPFAQIDTQQAIAEYEAHLQTTQENATNSGKKFQSRCGELGAGEQTYAFYRHLSAYVHPDVLIRELFLRDGDDTPDSIEADLEREAVNVYNATITIITSLLTAIWAWATHSKNELMLSDCLEVADRLGLIDDLNITYLGSKN